MRHTRCHAADDFQVLATGELGKIKDGTEGRNRTGTPLREPDFESGASTSSATGALKRWSGGA